MSEKQPKKRSTVRHTRAIQRDRRTRPTVAPSAPAVEARLTELVHPATLAQVAAYREAGLRQRLLTLPVMVAFVLSLVWRQLGSVSEAVRVLRQEGLLWADPLAVSQQAVSQRLRCLPAALFERVLLEVLPGLRERAQARQRPVPPALARAQRRFSAVLVLDGSTLDALLRKVGLLRERERAPLAGRMAALLDVAPPLPRQVWYEADPQASDQRFWDRAVAAVPQDALLLFDGGLLNYARYDELTAAGQWFLTRAAARMAYRVERVLEAHAARRDLLVWVGSHPDHRCAHLLRLLEVRRPGGWHRYLTNVLDPQRLSAEDAVALYAQRWRVEDAFLAVKRLLGLAYFWTGAVNGVLVQLWATWLLYAALVDLTDAVADALGLPFRDISLEMVYRGLYHFTQAYHRGAASEVVAYLAAHAKLLGLRKRKRRAAPGAGGALTSGRDP
jgi:Transposase DDE domain